MNRESLLAIMLLLLAPQLMAVSISKRFNFGLTKALTLSSGQLWDNGNKVCDTYIGRPSNPDDQFLFGSCPSQFAVTFDYFSGTIHYDTDQGSFDFALDQNTVNGALTFTSCQYGYSGDEMLRITFLNTGLFISVRLADVFNMSGQIDFMICVVYRFLVL